MSWFRGFPTEVFEVEVPRTGGVWARLTKCANSKSEGVSYEKHLIFSLLLPSAITLAYHLHLLPD